MKTQAGRLLGEKPEPESPTALRRSRGGAGLSTKTAAHRNERRTAKSALEVKGEHYAIKDNQ